MGIFHRCSHRDQPDLIVLRPQWLVDVFKAVFSQSYPSLRQHDRQSALQAGTGARYFRRGCMIKPRPRVTKGHFGTDPTIRLMPHVHKGFSDSDSDGVDEDDDDDEGYKGDAFSCVFYFSELEISSTSLSIISNAGHGSGFLPHGLFSRLAVKAARWTQLTSGSTPSLTRSSARCNFGPQKFWLILSQSRFTI